MKVLENLGFEDALRYIKKDLNVERAEWNGKKYLHLTQNGDNILTAEDCKPSKCVWHAPYTPTMADILATDWRVRE